MEVETDLLLGMDDVLLPAGLEWQAQSSALDARAHVSAHAVPSDLVPARVQPATRGFESALFDPLPQSARGGDARSVGASAPVPVPVPVHVPVHVPVTHASVEPKTAPQRAPLQPIEPSAASSDLPVPIRDTVRCGSNGSHAERLARLEQVHASECPHCTTATAHTKLVFGEGNPAAELVFVGDAPGETEDAVGRPFVGRAGEKLDEMISAMGLRRSDVYIANVLKSRPPDNRTPLAHEVERCGPYLLAQLSIIRPKAIVTLGGPATKLLLATDQGITRMRGVVGSVRLGDADGTPCDVPVLPTFHPAYLLRNYTIETRRQVWEDLKKALALLGREIPTRAASAST